MPKLTSVLTTRMPQLRGKTALSEEGEVSYFPLRKGKREKLINIYIKIS